jgi:hypothetical protein
MYLVHFDSMDKQAVYRERVRLSQIIEIGVPTCVCRHQELIVYLRFVYRYLGKTMWAAGVCKS